MAPLTLLGCFIATFFAQQVSPADLAFSEQQADFAPSQVLASPACEAGTKAKAAKVKQTISFFMIGLCMAVNLGSPH